MRPIKPIVLGLLAGITLMNSCTKDLNMGSVGGTIRIYDPQAPQVKTPIKGIRVLLVDTDYVIDSLDYSHNEAAIIDETATDSDGKYSIAGIPEGNYALIPIPDSIMYRFELENEADSVKFTVGQDSYEHSLDFIAAEQTGNEDVFQIRISIINGPNGGSISISRPVFLFNIFPTYNPVSIAGSMSSGANEITINPHYGIFGQLYVVSNNFRIKAFDSAGYYRFTRWISNNYFETPEYSHWQIDWEAQTIKRIE